MDFYIRFAWEIGLLMKIVGLPFRVPRPLDIEGMKVNERCFAGYHWFNVGFSFLAIKLSSRLPFLSSRFLRRVLNERWWLLWIFRLALYGTIILTYLVWSIR